MQHFSRPLTPVQSTPVNTANNIMLIEEEAEAVFNEIRNMRKEILADEDTDSKLSGASPGSKSVSPTPIITINVKVLSSPERSVSEIEEPVSPPSCHPDEGPPLLFSQSIEVSKTRRLTPRLYHDVISFRIWPLSSSRRTGRGGTRRRRR